MCKHARFYKRFDTRSPQSNSSPNSDIDILNMREMLGGKTLILAPILLRLRLISLLH